MLQNSKRDTTGLLVLAGLLDLKQISKELPWEVDMQFGTPDRAGLLSHPLNPGTMSRSGFLKSLAIGDHNQLDRYKLASSPDLAFRNVSFIHDSGWGSSNFIKYAAHHLWFLFFNIIISHFLCWTSSEFCSSTQSLKKHSTSFLEFVYQRPLSTCDKAFVGFQVATRKLGIRPETLQL